MSSLADRVNARLREVGLTSADLARACKIKAPSVTGWTSGTTKTIKGENLLRAAQALQCSPQWLATGIGPKIATDATSAAHAVREEVPANYLTDKLVEEGKEILRLLDREARREAVQWLRGFAAGRKIEPWATAQRRRDSASPPGRQRGLPR